MRAAVLALLLLSASCFRAHEHARRADGGAPDGGTETSDALIDAIGGDATADAIGSDAPAIEPPSGCVAFEAAGRLFARCPGPLDFVEAELKCGEVGWTLATLQPATVGLAVRDAVSATGVDDAWVGLRLEAGEWWTWSNGDHLSWDPWDPRTECRYSPGCDPGPCQEPNGSGICGRLRRAEGLVYMADWDCDGRTVYTVAGYCPPSVTRPIGAICEHTTSD
jgi:hypothetical protein